MNLGIDIDNVISNFNATLLQDYMQHDQTLRNAGIVQIWDIAVVAYLINPAWFTTQTISCPQINDDTSYQLTTDPHYEFVKNYIREAYRLEEKIINLCDLMCTTEILTVEKRLVDLLLRHGVFAQTHYHLTQTMQLKHDFDALLGHNLYDLFPTIKDRL